MPQPPPRMSPSGSSGSGTQGAASPPLPPITLSASGSDSERLLLKSEADKALKKLNSSQDFLESHLMRASVLTPMDGGREEGGGGASAGPRGVERLETIGSSSLVMAAESGSGGDGSGDGGEGEQHHAGGQGATALSVVVRGNAVVVANTG